MINLREMKADELRDVARGYGIVGAWKKTKDQLIESVLNAVKLNGDTNKYYDASLELQNEPESTESDESDNLSAEEEKTPERNSELKKYAAWVKDRETKELTKVFGEANSREEFYNLIKGKYRVRLITKPEKIDDECEQWKIRHARNLIIKKEKYAADKEKAKALGMNVMQYRKEVKKS